MKYIFALCLLFIPALCFGATTEEITDLAVAQQYAKETNTELLLIFSADWCGPCKSLKSGMKPYEEQIMEKFTICRIDIDENRSVKNKYKVNAVPSYMILDDEGSIKKRGQGYGDINLFLNWLGL